MKIMKTIKEYFADKKEKYRLQHEEYLRDSFDVTERGGHMWLTHNGVAFMKVGELSQASDIAGMLNNAREYAVEFERL